MLIWAQAMQFELAAANSPEDYAICAMAGLRSKYEIARVDHTMQKVYHKNIGLVGDKIKLPDAKWWHPFSEDGGDMAFCEKPELFTSHFSLHGSGAYKYNFWGSMNDNGQEVKAYQHCGGLHIIFVRRPATLNVYLSTSQRTKFWGTTHMITLKKVSFPYDVIIFEKEFGNDDSDITLGQILPVAWRHLIENNHITSAGKLQVIFQLEVVFEGYGHLLSRLSTVLVKRFGRKGPSKRQKTSSGSGGAATQLAEVPRWPPAVAEWPHHTGTTEIATPPPEITQHMRELRENIPHATLRCPLVPGGWAINWWRGRNEIEEDASESSGLDNDDDDDDDDDGP